MIYILMKKESTEPITIFKENDGYIEPVLNGGSDYHSPRLPIATPY